MCPCADVVAILTIYAAHCIAPYNLRHQNITHSGSHTISYNEAIWYEYTFKSRYIQHCYLKVHTYQTKSLNIFFNFHSLIWNYWYLKVNFLELENLPLDTCFGINFNFWILRVDYIICSPKRIKSLFLFRLPSQAHLLKEIIVACNNS